MDYEKLWADLYALAQSMVNRTYGHTFYRQGRDHSRAGYMLLGVMWEVLHTQLSSPVDGGALARSVTRELDNGN